MDQKSKELMFEKMNARAEWLRHQPNWKIMLRAAAYVAAIGLVVFGACSLIGCGAEYGTPIGQAYVLCLEYDQEATADDIDALVRVIRIARDDGVPAGFVLGALAPVCEGESEGCVHCLTALVDAVY